MFVNVAEELKKARQNKYAIGAFNTNNLEATKAICLAAKNFKVPIIIQTTPGAIQYAGLKQIFDIIKNEIEESGIMAAVHLDHATDFEVVRDAVEAGYRSVMIDGSKLSFEENVALTKRVVEFAHSKNVSVEGEIGAIGSEEGGHIVGESVMSSPEMVSQFIHLTGVDSVAVSIGNEHGAPQGEKLDLKLLEDIAKVVNIPLVLHGSSGLSESDIENAIEIGISKINVDTAIRKAFIKGLEGFDPDTVDYRKVLEKSIQNIENVVDGKIKLFSNNK